jgi:predicted permease
MAIIGEWLRRLNFLIRRRAMEDELRREMESHRALMEDPRAFGNTLRLREEARDAWGWRWLDDLVRDARLALRTLSHSPGFAITAILTLALGIGANIAMFTVVNSMLLRPLYAQADRVMSVYGRGTKPFADSSKPSEEYRAVSYPNYLDLRAGTNDIFAPLAAYATKFVGLDAGQGARRALALSVTANYFDIFNRPLALGRPFTSEEERPGADIRVAIVSFPLWQQRGADAGIIGQPVRINGETFTVIGVTAKGFTGTSIPGPEVWVPLGAYAIFDKNAAAQAEAEAQAQAKARGGAGAGVGAAGAAGAAGAVAAPALGARARHQLGVIGKLRDGISNDTASAALTTVAGRLERAFPAVNAGYTLAMSAPSRLMFVPGPDSGTTLTLFGLLLMSMPLIVLLVACLNLADLLLARGHARRQELAIRASLGGGRWRLVRQLLTEGLLLAVAGAAVGLVLSAWATSAVVASLRAVLPVSLMLPELDLDWRVFAGTVGFSLLASLVFGAWPAWDLTRRATATDLKQRTGGEGRQPGGISVGNILVIGQTALSLLLLACGGLFLMSAIGAATSDPGFRLERGLLAEVDPSLLGYDEARVRQFHLAVVDRMRAVAGVEAVTIGSSFPFTEFGDSRIVGRAGDSGPASAPASASASASSSASAPATARSEPLDAGFMVVGRDYARTLGLRVLGGRDFTEAEMISASSERVAIVDDALAQRLWPDASGLGQLIQLMDDRGVAAGSPVRVIGVVSAVNESLGNPHPSPHVYVPLGQHPASAMTLQLRVAAGQDQRAMLNTVARIIREVDEHVAVLRLATWRERLDASVDVWIYRAGARVCGAFGAMALLLAVIGIYGVKSYVVSRRTREFGIRLAIGAHPRALLWQILREGLRLTTIGIVIGLLLALGAGQFLQHMLYQVNSVEPLVLIAAPAILLTASLLAALIPALRATRVDPTAALRTE